MRIDFLWVRRTGANALIARYGYDPLNRRLWKEQYRDANGQALAQAQRSYYLYADEGLIAEAKQAISINAQEQVTSSSTPAIHTQYGPTPDSLFGTQVLFIKTPNNNGQSTVAYYHHDHAMFGTPLQATDKAGNLVWSASYNAQVGRYISSDPIDVAGVGEPVCV